MFDQPFQSLPCHIQPIKLDVTLFQFADDAQGLRIVVKTAKGLHGFVQRIFTGMTESGMAEIMRQ